MLPKINRADKKTIDRVFKEGKFLNSPSFTFRYLRTEALTPRLSFLAPKSIAKLAVKRNALRRWGYRALEKNMQHVPRGLVGAFIFKRSPVDQQTFQNEIETILCKIN
mgnify:CR=1 FL=1